MGIEPTTTAWKAVVLPLNYTRILLLEATPGFEPGIKVLQTSALPLGYAALIWSGRRNSNRDHRLDKVTVYH